MKKPTKPKVPSKGFKFRLYLTIEQKCQIARVFGSCRYVYNRLLSETIAEYELWKSDPSLYSKPEISISEFSRRVTQWRKEEKTNWLAEVSSVPLQQAERHLIQAFSTFFKKGKGYPRFKSKYDKQRAEFTTSGYRLKDGKLHLGLFDTGIDVQWSRDLPDVVKTCSVSRDPSGKYYASFICEYTPDRKSGEGTIGIDVGITDLAVMSNGDFIKNPKYLIKYQNKLALYQQRHARKKKGSKNKAKSRLKIARIHDKIANCRSDNLHQLSSRIVRENQAIAIEQLTVKNMLQNGHLAKHIADAGWRTFRTYLTYKVRETSHGKLVLADPYFPSTQYCSSCLTRPQAKIKLGVTKWTCSHCDTTHQRDLNAALNLEHYLKQLLKNWTPGTKVLLAKAVRLEV